MPFNSITRAISLMKSAQNLRQAMSDKFFCPETFPKILGVSMVCSCAGGYLTMDRIHTKRLERQEEMYTNAWETYKHKRGVYEPSPQPISLQKRRFTRVKLAPTSEKEIDSGIERVRLSQD